MEGCSMGSTQDQSAVGTESSGAAGTPSTPSGAAPTEESGTAQAAETASTYVGRHVPRPSPGYDDSVDYADPPGPSGAALGFTALAAVLMMLSGVANFLEGLAAIIRGSYFVNLPNYAYDISVHGWGWTHLIAGIVVFAAGVCLFMDMTWARVAGVILASFSLMMTLVYIPYFPVWSIIVIALDAFVIWALLTPRHRYA